MWQRFEANIFFMLLLWILENDLLPHHCHRYWWVLMLRKICPRGNAQYLSAKWQETSRFIDLLRVYLFACLSYLLIQPSDILYRRTWLFPIRFKTSLYVRGKKNASSLHMQEVHFPLGFLRKDYLTIKMISRILSMDLCMNIYIYVYQWYMYCNFLFYIKRNMIEVFYCFI